MKKVLTLLLTIFISFSLSGCFSVFKPTPPEIIYKTKIVILEPPADLLQKIDKPLPPDKKLYTSSTLADREELLTDLINKQMFIIDKANLAISKIKSWVETEKNNQLKEIAK